MQSLAQNDQQHETLKKPKKTVSCK